MSKTLKMLLLSLVLPMYFGDEDGGGAAGGTDAGAAGGASAGTGDTSGTAAPTGGDTGTGAGATGTDGGAGATGTTPPANPAAGSTGDAGTAGTNPADDANKSYWPIDWREKYANGDEKVLNRLKRFDSPKAAIDSFFAFDKKLSSGAMRSVLPENATDEQKSQWREENGIPADHAGYAEKLQLADGLVIGEQDTPMIADFFEAAHKSNMTPAQVSQAINWYYDSQERQLAAIQERDDGNRKVWDDELRAEWGDTYRRNLAAINGLLGSAPKDVQEGFMGGRLADGTPIGNHPGVLRWLANMALEVNPAATVVPGAGTNSMSQIDSEISAIEKRMGGTKEERDSYFKDEKAQARYRDLITARDKLQAKG